MLMRPLLVTLLAFAVLAPAAHAGEAFVVRHPVYGGAEALFGTCPDDSTLPPAGYVCEDTYVIVARTTAVIGGGSIAKPATPWTIFTETARLVFDGTEEPQVTVLRTGGLAGPGVTATVDTTHLQTASAEATVPMSDGTTFDFAATWQTRGDGRFVFGNDGPAADLQSIRTRCLTLNALAHQKFTFATMSGTLNGQPIRSYSAFDFDATIFNNSFKLVEVQHGDGCP